MSSLVLGSQNGSPAERRRKPRILIVDDYPDARTLLAIALQRRGGYEVTAAGSAVEALRLIDERFVRTTDAGSRALRKRHLRDVQRHGLEPWGGGGRLIAE